VLSLLKAKHQVADKESRRLLASIDHDLSILDQSLKQGALTSPLPKPDSVGSIETGRSDSMGSFVDISV
jgi:hypothetical protein